MDRIDKFILLKCLKFGKEKLGVKTSFKLKLSSKRDNFKTFAYYDPANKIIAVYIKNRAVPDICRSILHELVHHFDNESGNIKGNEPDIGKDDDVNDIENRANSKAGAIIKEFGYKLKDETGIDIYNL